MEITTITSEKTSNFLKEIAVDENFWKTWIASPACCLNSQEIIIINGFILTGSHQYACLLLNIPYSSASNTFRNCKKRIAWSYHVFQKWLTEGLLEDQKVISYTTDLEKFLHTPITDLVIEPTLKRKLMILNDTIFEVLSEYSEKDLKSVRGLGSKKIKGFRLLLIENNCLHFLK
jgi:hypothetical protein